MKDVIINDKLGIAKELEDQMCQLIAGYYDKWDRKIEGENENPIFRQFINTSVNQPDDERGQPRPVKWPSIPVDTKFDEIEWSRMSWQVACRSADLPHSAPVSSTTVLMGDTRLALFRNNNGKLFCSQNICGHQRGQGILSQDENKGNYISCPMHERNFDLKSDSCKNDGELSIATFEVKEEERIIYANLPPPSEFDKTLNGCSKRRNRKCRVHGSRQEI